MRRKMTTVTIRLFADQVKPLERLGADSGYNAIIRQFIDTGLEQVGLRKIKSITSRGKNVKQKTDDNGTSCATDEC